jgi:hypothetical protein
MRKENALRVAPGRDGVQVANAWRFWAQGDEFYAAARDMAKLGKVSFHSRFNWQFRAGTVANRLAPPLSLSNSWLHALEIVFLVDRNVLLPLAQREDKVALIETPEGYKLLVDLLLSTGGRVPTSLPAEMVGNVQAAHRLRNGAQLLAVTRTLALTDADRALITETRAKLRVNFTQDPPTSGVYVEATWQTFSPTTGNAIGIVPVGYDSLAREAGGGPPPGTT